ncbi:MAG: Sir2 silent information regulator family NAD-dependent deacetylase [Prevotella sp.]|nr:Sir2 silent information regulator family NAD-dependent deacetylase [Prevotella sp.]
MTSTKTFSERIATLKQQIAEADHIIIGAGSGLSSAAGIDYAGADFRHEFKDWISRYGITDLYSSSFYPFETEEERWACWAKHIWFARYQPEAKPLYKQLLELVKGKDYFVITTNVDGQFQKAGFDTDRIYTTQGDYGLFQPADGYPQETYDNKEWVERVLPQIRDCRIPTELIPTTPDGQPVAMNLRCDNTFVEDENWHRQALRYSDFVHHAADNRLLLLEFGVGYNTPVIIRFPFEQMAAQFPQTTLVRFNRDYPQPSLQLPRDRFTTFAEDLPQIMNHLTNNEIKDVTESIRIPA